MARIETWLDCDLKKTVEVVPLKGHLYSGDDSANLFGVRIVKDGIPFPVSGTLMCYGMRDDGVTIVTSANVTNSATPSVVLEHDFYDVIGPIQIALRLVSGNDQTLLAACSTYVMKTTSGQLIDGGQAVPSLETLIARMDDCQRAATAANEAATAAQSQVSAAETAAQTAATNATAAAESAQSARAQATRANTRAETAEAAAISAQSSAQTATNSATAAQTSARNAETSASSAQSSAISAQTAASNAQASAQSAQTAAQSAQSQVSSANAAATQARSDADNAVSAARTASGSASEAAANAQAANTNAQNASALANQLSSTFSQLLPTLVNNAVVQNNALYLLHDNEVVAGPFSGFGGGGGGGGGSSSNVRFTFASSDGNYYITAATGTDVVIGLTWLCTEDEEPTGNGTLKLLINNVQRYSKSVPQGTIQENVTQYLREGENTLTFTMTNTFGTVRTRVFTITMINLRVESSFDSSELLYGQIFFPYTPYGNLQKTMHFKIDGVDAVTPVPVSGYGRQITQAIPAQSHGSHVLTVYYIADLNGVSVQSNTLTYDLCCIDSESDETIITANYDSLTINQYGTINFRYMVYSPQSQLSDVQILLNGSLISELVNIDRTMQTFSYRMDSAGTNVITIMSGTAAKVLQVTVNAVTIDVEPETEGLKLYLNSYGRSNSEVNPAVWTYINQNDSIIAATFSGFNWVSDGWQMDEDGVTVMRVSGNARIAIPYMPFETDKRASGFTVEIDFRTRDVRNYDSPILSCMDNGRGFQLTSQKFTLSSVGSSISMQFKEEEHVRATFVVSKRTNYRLIYCYINGIMSGVTRYPTNDNFAQTTPKGITIGSNDATIDLYTIRIYDYDLPMKQVEANWIVDSSNSSEMLSRYGRNNIRNESDMVVAEKLPTDLPYMIISATELPQYKGDKKPCSGVYIDPVNTDNSFTFDGCEINVQGTSSQYYTRKNYTMKFNGGFQMSSGTTESKYKLRANSIPEKQFVMKADVASSEGANNVELVRLYNDTCPYRTPAQQADSRVRQGIDGFPIVIFWMNPDTNETTFMGKYNFNNAKGTEATYGFTEGDESWEMRNNTSNRVLYKDDSFSNIADDTDEFGNPVPSWQKDFECRYPDEEYYDYTQLKEFISWVKSTDTTQATGAALAQTADFGETTVTEVNGEMVSTPVTYTHDTAAYRLAKFRAELGNYCEVQSALYYYLFTEMFLMVDSRAKNSFPSFIGTPIEGAAGNE